MQKIREIKRGRKTERIEKEKWPTNGIVIDEKGRMDIHNTKIYIYIYIYIYV